MNGEHSKVESVTTDLVSTPGPWRWEVNFASRCIHLVGGKPQYDMTVMDFVRWGMGQAQPRFVVDGLLHKAEEFARVAPQRSHHKEWFQLLSHPDANLIAAAPEMLEALKNMVGFCATGCVEAEMAMDDARKAIAKATGEHS